MARVPGASHLDSDDSATSTSKDAELPVRNVGRHATHPDGTRSFGFLFLVHVKQHVLTIRYLQSTSSTVIREDSELRMVAQRLYSSLSVLQSLVEATAGKV